jgi:hypothetical protein
MVAAALTSIVLLLFHFVQLHFIRFRRHKDTLQNKKRVIVVHSVIYF